MGEVDVVVVVGLLRGGEAVRRRCLEARLQTRGAVQEHDRPERAAVGRRGRGGAGRPGPPRRGQRPTPDAYSRLGGSPCDQAATDPSQSIHGKTESSSLDSSLRWLPWRSLVTSTSVFEPSVGA